MQQVEAGLYTGREKRERAFAVDQGLAVHVTCSDPTGALRGGCYQARVTRPRNLLKVTQPVNEWQTLDSNPGLTLKPGSFHSN